MNSTDQLIDELCLEGVTFVEIGDIAEIKAGQSISKIFIQQNQGDYPVVNSGKEPLGFINTYNTENNEIGITSRGAGVGFVSWTEGKYYRGNLNYGLEIHDHKALSNRFLYHVLLASKNDIDSLCVFSGIPALNASQLKRLKIPLPPLLIQEEIAQILDNFTLLTAELTAELTARQLQYEYYRDKLLTFDGDINWVKLEDIAVIKNGSTYKYFNEGTIPVYGTGGIMTYVDTFAYDKPTVLIPRKGSIDKLYYVDVPFWNVDTIFYTEINDELVEPKFLYYFLQTERLENLNIAGGVPSLTQTMLKLVKIPLPPLAEQARIVSILDKFDALVNDLSSGIPAEIEARQKQYEYYRDRLLTFKEKVS